MRHHRKLEEVREQFEQDIALLDRAECQFLDDPTVAARFVGGQQFDEPRLGSMKWSIHIDVSTRITRQMPSAVEPQLPEDLSRREPLDDGRSLHGSTSAVPDGAAPHSQ